MSKQKTQRVITIEVVVELPTEHAYTDSEIIDTLKVRSTYTEIKIKGHGLPEPA